jgi:hypothetical protein
MNTRDPTRAGRARRIAFSLRFRCAFVVDASGTVSAPTHPTPTTSFPRKRESILISGVSCTPAFPLDPLRY